MTDHDGTASGKPGRPRASGVAARAVKKVLNSPGQRREKVKEFASVEHLNPEAVAAFVDGELTPGAMHRARVHLVHCTECRNDVDTQRRAAERLRSACDDSITAPSTLIAALTSIASSCPPEGPTAEDSAYKQPETFVDKVDLILRAVTRPLGRTGGHTKSTGCTCGDNKSVDGDVTRRE